MTRLTLFLLVSVAWSQPLCTVVNDKGQELGATVCGSLPQTQMPHEMLWLEWAGTPVEYVKAPVDATLQLNNPGGSGTISDRQLHEVVDSDAPAPLQVITATFHPPARLGNPHASVPGGPPPVTPCTGVCVTYSSQGDAAISALTGKKLTNFQAVEALVCSTHPAQVPGGLVLQMANAIGIQTIQSKVGAAIVQQRVGLNWRTITINTLKYASMIGLAYITAGIWHPGVAAAFLTATVHEGADDIPKLLAPGAPNPDPFLNGMLDGTVSLSLSPTNCADLLFSGVYAGPGTSFVTAPIQLAP